MGKKPLIVYYSLSGNTKFIGETLNKIIDADIEELKPKKELKVGKSSTYFWGGAQVYMKQKPKLKPLTHDPLSYDMIFLGTPVWAWNYSPPIRTYLHELDLSGKKFAIWTTADSDTEKGIKRLRTKLEQANADVVGQIKFIKPLNADLDEIKNRLKEWTSNILVS